MYMPDPAWWLSLIHICFIVFRCSGYGIDYSGRGNGRAGNGVDAPPAGGERNRERHPPELCGEGRIAYLRADAGGFLHGGDANADQRVTRGVEPGDYTDISTCLLYTSHTNAPGASTMNANGSNAEGMTGAPNSVPAPNSSRTAPRKVRESV